MAVTRIGLLNAPDGSIGSGDKFQIATLISFGNTPVTTKPINFYSRSFQYDTVLDLKFEGQQDDDFTTDDSPSHHVMVANGTVFIDTTTFAQGSSSTYFAADFANSGAGGTTFWSTSASSDWDFTTKDFIFESNVRWEYGVDPGSAQYNYFVTGDGILNFSIGYYWTGFAGGSDALNKLAYRTLRTFGPNFTAVSTVFIPNLFQWYRIKLTKVSSTYTWFVDSAQSGSATTSSDAGIVLGGQLTIGGGSGGSTPNSNFQGWMDGLTIIKNNNDPVTGAPINFYSKSNSSSVNFYGQ